MEMLISSMQSQWLVHFDPWWLVLIRPVTGGKCSAFAAPPFRLNSGLCIG